MLGGLATWRLSHLLVAEDGPLDVVVRLRGAVDRTPLAGVMDCFGCTSLWAGPVVASVALRGRAGPVDTLLAGTALSGAAYLAELVRTASAGPAVPAWLPEPDVDSPLVTVRDVEESAGLRE